MKSENSKPRVSRTKRSTSKQTHEWTDDQKLRIAEIAYHRFVARGGEHGYEIADWLEAEKEFAAMQSAPKRRRASVAKR